MAAVGLFPLGIVLLPTEQVPLHIFEPRYRELIGECRNDGTPFGLVLVDDAGGIREVGTLAHILEAEELGDGRYNIVVEGRERFRILERTEGRSFMTAEVEPVSDVPSPPPGATITRALDLFDRLVALTGSDLERPAEGHPQLSYAIAGHFELDAEVKQRLLEELAETPRLDSVLELLERSYAAIVARREVAARAQTNGKH
ncbi:MAG: LON peptidase substrate-binding domain-containing protein [Gaiellales bacterium]